MGKDTQKEEEEEESKEHKPEPKVKNENIPRNDFSNDSLSQNSHIADREAPIFSSDEDEANDDHGRDTEYRNPLLAENQNMPKKKAPVIKYNPVTALRN